MKFLYKRANIDKKLFSKIRNPEYRPSKSTILALAIALELDFEETQMLLQKAGYSLSDSYLSDRIVRYFIDHKYYDIDRLNYTLFYFDQVPLSGIQ